MPTADWATSNSAYGTPQPVDATAGATSAALGLRSSAMSWDDASEGFGRWINQINGTASSNREAAELAREQRQWEADMDNTKYQRAVEDMKKAGLNPATISGLSSGSVGSAPSGAAASTHAPSGNIIGSLLSLMTLMVLKGTGGEKSLSSLVKSGDGKAYAEVNRLGSKWRNYR